MFADDDFDFSWDQPTPSAQEWPEPSTPNPDQGFEAPAAPAPSAPPAAMMPSSVDPLANTPSAAGQGSDANPYADHVAALSGAATDEDRALARNNLMRSLYSDFQAAGHDVSWEGEQLVVDGLSYDVAGGTPPDLSAAAIHGGVTGKGGTSTRQTNTPVPAGYDARKWNDPNNPSYGDWKYTAGRIIAGGGTPQQVADAIGGRLYAPGSDWVIAPDGHVFDTVIDYGPGGQNAPEWAQQDFDAQGNWIPPNFGAAAPVARSSPSALRAGSGGPAIPSASGLPPVTPYTFSYDSLMANDPIDDQVEQSLSALLAHPESLDPHTVEVMKAKAKNELTDAQQQEEADIVNLGYQGGIGESPWTQSQRLNSRFNRDVALSKSNTDVDIQAAQSRMSDRRAAIDEGLKYAAQKQDRRQFAELAKQKAAELGISEQRVVAEYTLGILDAQLKKYGMDLDAEIAREGFQIDWTKIDQADTHFLMELGFKYADLNETASEFDASH